MVHYQSSRARRKQRAAPVKVIVDLKEINQFGVWEVGLLTSFKREVDQRAGVLRLCRLNPSRSGYFQNDRFAGQFDIYGDIERAARFRLCNSVPPRIGLAMFSAVSLGPKAANNLTINVRDKACAVRVRKVTVFPLRIIDAH